MSDGIIDNKIKEMQVEVAKLKEAVQKLKDRTICEHRNVKTGRRCERRSNGEKYCDSCIWWMTINKVE